MEVVLVEQFLCVEFLQNNSRMNIMEKRVLAFLINLRTQMIMATDSNSIVVNRSRAVLLTAGYNYNGVKADIKVWNPFVEHDDEYSASRIELGNGAYNDYESIEAGWVVNPSVYGNRETCIHTYWTVDGSKTTGCFYLICPGFVQTSN